MYFCVFDAHHGSGEIDSRSRSKSLNKEEGEGIWGEKKRFNKCRFSKTETKREIYLL